MTRTDDARWTAVRERDRGAVFVYAVRTTGIACRTGCPSRLPRREHVAYFTTLDEARAAGFRPCKRCLADVDAPERTRAALMTRACQMLDDSERSLAEIARAVGFSRYHFQRAFRADVGMTPAAYRRAGRAERLRARLAAGDGVTTTIQDAGFGSPSRAYDAGDVGMTFRRYRAGARDERIRYTIARAGLGSLIVAATERGICAVAFAEDEAALVEGLAREFPHAEIARADDALERERDVVASLVRGETADADLALDLRGTVFQRRVWAALRAIPRGERRTYGAVAGSIGRPSAARAVATACTANRVAVLVPCHRVVPAAGGTGGYRWGAERKRDLLAREDDAAE